MGFEVTALERNPVIAALLQDAAARAADGGHAPKRIIQTDAIEFLASRPNRWDCVYLDPMFPPKRRASTLTKRPLRLLRELVGVDPDQGRLFESARVAARKRVVVKRPDHSVPAFGHTDTVVAGKLICYDIYLQV